MMETNLDNWDPDDLAPRLAEANWRKIRNALKMPAMALETCLRGEVGLPPSQRARMALDSAESAEYGENSARNEAKVTRQLAKLTDQEIEMLETALRVIDPSETLLEDFRGMTPA